MIEYSKHNQMLLESVEHLLDTHGFTCQFMYPPDIAYGSLKVLVHQRLFMEEGLTFKFEVGPLQVDYLHDKVLNFLESIVQD
jgi:hypothetical protein